MVKISEKYVDLLLHTHSTIFSGMHEYIVPDEVKNAWKKNRLFQRIRAQTQVIIDYQKKNPTLFDLKPKIEYRIRGIVITGTSTPKILLMNKISEVPFYEMSFKGGHEYSLDHRTVQESLFDEAQNELADIFQKNKGDYTNALITRHFGPYIDLKTSPKKNSDIMNRINSSGTELIYSFFANYILYAPKEFDVFKENPSATEEHSEFKWASLGETESELEKSALNSRKDRDLYCFQNFIQKIDFSLLGNPLTTVLPGKIGNYRDVSRL
ncbi:MAG: hypothetical protein ACP5NV_01880 [Candidatus Woesearchaeota archaeon]